MKEGKEGIETNNDGKRRTTGIGGRNRSNKEGIEDVKETDPFPFPTVLTFLTETVITTLVFHFVLLF
jgi:hypothetical protein